MGNKRCNVSDWKLKKDSTVYVRTWKPWYVSITVKYLNLSGFKFSTASKYELFTQGQKGFRDLGFGLQFTFQKQKNIGNFYNYIQ